MKRFVAAAVLAALFGARADAQITPGWGFVQPPGPPSGMGNYYYYRTGHVVVGLAGYYPYDTGEFALGGFGGVARYGGYYTMGGAPAPGGFAGPPAPLSSGGGWCGPRGCHPGRGWSW